jgi:hypothetical protein
MIRSGPPKPPSIFIGSAVIVVPVGGSFDMSATFSQAGIFLDHVRIDGNPIRHD